MLSSIWFVAFVVTIGLSGSCDPPNSVELEVVLPPEDKGLDQGTRTLLETRWRRVREFEGPPSAQLGIRYGELGQILHALDSWPSAEASYRNALRLDPSEPQWSYLLGQIVLGRGRLEEASEAFTTVLDLRPADVPTSVALVRVLREQGRTEDAERLARAAVESAPQSPAAHYTLAEILGDQGRFEEAVSSYRKTLELDPQATKVYVPLASSLRALGRAEESRSALGRRGTGAVSMDDPWLARLQQLRPGAQSKQRAEEAFARGDFEMAADSFEKALEARPETVELLVNLGASLYRVGRLEEAEAKLKMALRLDANSAAAQFNLAVLFVATGKTSKAVESYRTTLSLDPGHPGAGLNLANLLLREGRGELAEAQYLDLQRRDPMSTAVRQGLIQSLALQGAWGQAIEAAQDSLSVNSKDPELINTLARLLAAAPVEALRDGAESLRLAEALARQTGNAFHLETLAMALAEVGRFGEAAQLQQRLVGIFGDAGQSEKVDVLMGNLAGYQRQNACRNPFPWLD